MAKNIDISLRITNQALYKKLRDLFDKKQIIEFSIGGANINSEIRNLKEKLGGKPIPIFVEPQVAQKDINQIKKIVQDNMKPVNIPLTTTQKNIDELQKLIQEGLKPVNVNLRVGNLASLNKEISELVRQAQSGGGQTFNRSKNNYSFGNPVTRNANALIREEAADIAAGNRTATQTGRLSRSARNRAFNEVQTTQVGKTRDNIASRSTLRKFNDAEAKALLDKATELIRGTKQGFVDPSLRQTPAQLEAAIKSGKFQGKTQDKLVGAFNAFKQANQAAAGKNLNVETDRDKLEAQRLQEKNTKYQTNLVKASQQLEQKQNKALETERLKNTKFQVSLVKNSNAMEYKRLIEQEKEKDKNTKFQVSLVRNSQKLEEKQNKELENEKLKNIKFQTNLVKNSNAMEYKRVVEQEKEKDKNNKYQVSLVKNSQKLEEKQKLDAEKEVSKNTKYRLSLIKNSTKMEQKQLDAENKEREKNTKFQVNLVKNSNLLEFRQKLQEKKENDKNTKYQVSLVQNSQKLEEQQKAAQVNDLLKRGGLFLAGAKTGFLDPSLKNVPDDILAEANNLQGTTKGAQLLSLYNRVTKANQDAANKTLNPITKQTNADIFAQSRNAIANIKQGGFLPTNITQIEQELASRKQSITGTSREDLAEIARIEGIQDNLSRAKTGLQNKTNKQIADADAQKKLTQQQIYENDVKSAIKQIKFEGIAPTDLPVIKQGLDFQLQSATGKDAQRLAGLKYDLELAERDSQRKAQSGIDKDFVAQGKQQTATLNQNRRNVSLTSKFNGSQLAAVAVLGAEKAADEYEEEHGLAPGTIDRSKIGQVSGKKGTLRSKTGRFSFDPSRLIADAGTINELGFAGLFGGVSGLVGGALGGAALSGPGVFLGSAIAQGVTTQISEIFGKIADTLKDAAKAGIEFEQSVSSLSSSFLSTGKVVNRAGEEVSPEIAFQFQSQRAKGLLTKARAPLSQLGLGSSTQAAILSSIGTGLGESGFNNVSDEDIIQLALPAVARIKSSDPEVFQNAPRLKNLLTDLFTGTLKPNEEIAPAFRSVQTDIKSAIKAGDLEKLKDTFSKFNNLVVALTHSSENAGPALSRITSSLDSVKIVFGDNLQKALIPGLEKLAKLLENPKLISGFENLGDNIGKGLNFVLELFTGFFNGLNTFSTNVGRAIQFIVDKFNELNTILSPQPVFASDEDKEKFNKRQDYDRLVKKYGTSKEQFAKNLENSPFSGNDLTSQSNPNIDKNLENLIKDSDEGTREGRFQQHITGLAIKLRKGDITQQVHDAQQARALEDFNTETQLSNIDQGTRRGQLEAGNIGIERQVKAGTLSREVADAQISRANQAFGLEQELAGTNQLTFAGQFKASQIGIQQQLLNKAITPEVAQAQDQNNLVNISTQVVDSFIKLNDTVLATSRGLEDLKIKNSDLANELIIATNNLNNFDKQAEISRLQGQDKLQAIAAQIVEKGGINPLNGTLGQTFLDTPEDKRKRDLDILQRQFQVAESEFKSPDAASAGVQRPSPFEAGLALQKSALQKNVTGITRQQEDNPLEQFKLKFGSAKEISDLGTKFGGDPNKLNELIPGLGDKFTESQKLITDSATKLGLDPEKLSQSLSQPVEKISNTLDTLVNGLVDKIKDGMSRALKESFN